MRFVNEYWVYPGAQPEELQNLHSKAEGLLSPILVFCELTNSRSKLTKATRAGHHFVSGRIGLYKSNDYLGPHAGTRGLISLSDKDVELSDEDIDKIWNAWDWLKANNPLIRDVDVDAPGNLTNASERVEHNSESDGQRNINTSELRAYHMAPIGTGGPSTANESSKLENLPFGVLGREQHVVKYSNPCLLGYLFPTLYPEGRGYFSKNYDGIQGGRNRQIECYEGRPCC